MEFKPSLELSVTKNDNVYTFKMPVGAPCGETYDVLFQMLQKVAEEAKNIAARAAPAAPAQDTGDASVS